MANISTKSLFMESAGNRGGALAARLRKRRHVLDNIRSSKVSGSSRLENFEMKEEEDVYDVVDEYEYADIVERRRQGNEFVVDDNGNGYKDDGEEVLGIVEDVYESQKRKAVNIGDEFTTGDSKRKAQRLSKAALLASSAGKTDTIFSFVKTGAQTTQRISAAAPIAGAAEDIDIDALLDLPSEEKAIDDKTKRTLNRKNAGVAQITNDRYRSPQDFVDSEVSLTLDQARCTVPLDLITCDDFKNTGDFVVKNSRVEKETPEIVGFKYALPNISSEKISTPECIENCPYDPDPPSCTEKISFLKGGGRKIKSIQKKHENKLLVIESDNLVDIDTEAFPLLPAASFSVSSNGTGKNRIDPALWLCRQDVNENHVKTFEYMNMYWTDVSEMNGTIYLFGKVHLDPHDSSHGNYASCCVAVQGNERNLFILPRCTGQTHADGSMVRAEMKDVYKDLNTKVLCPEILSGKGEGQVFKVKKVIRKYAFEFDDVPRGETEYYKVKYSAKFGVPSSQVCTEGTEHIQRIFGATSSCLEYFLLKRKLYGPCWIQIKNPRPVQSSFSWTKIEVGIDDPKLISVLETKESAPPLTTMSVSMKTVLNPSSHTHEIVAISAMINYDVAIDGESKGDVKCWHSFTLIRQLGSSCGSSYPSVFPHDISAEVKKIKDRIDINVMPNERAMLDSFFIRLGNVDPDVLVSHNLFGYEFDVLVARAAANKVGAWSKLGRLRRSKIPRSIGEKDFAAGRILCDTYKASKEFLRETTYSLTHLVKSQLNIERKDIDPVDVPRYFSSSHDIIRISSHNLHDAVLILKLMLKLQVIPMTKQLTHLSGNVWNRTLRGARAERIEYLLLHEFHRLKYILPDKKGFNDSTTKYKNNYQLECDEDHFDNDTSKAGGMIRKRGRAGYTGGLVLEPKRGLYDTYILLLDFNSLYPSLIQEYNICFTTLDWTHYINDDGNAFKGVNSDDLIGENVEKFYIDEARKSLISKPDSCQPVGVLPRLIKNLVERRREVKKLMKSEQDAVKLAVYDIRQKALKLTANSMYGCLGFSFSRFYARPIAALVTSMGREALQRTVDLSTNMLKLDVIYGDTDSVMINTRCTDLRETTRIGHHVIKEVNKFYKALELDLDGVFKSMLLLKKKKYAALKIEEVDGKEVVKQELKGLDLVRRDWCLLSKDIGKTVVNEILSGKPKDETVEKIHTLMNGLARDARSGLIDLQKFVITKGLNKNPRDYPDHKGQPHLQVALKMLADGKPVNIGDHIPYVICKGEVGVAAPQRAYHPDEVNRSYGRLVVDYEWYLSQQILPPISRLCEPIEGTSVGQISLHLGLDVTRFSASSRDDSMQIEWGFKPRIQLTEEERFKDSLRIEISCYGCSFKTNFPGVLRGLYSGLNCPSCGAMYYGLRSPSACYGYLSNATTLLVRDCVKKYYDCWLRCDDITCGRRTTQQSADGYGCIDGCHGRMKQQYSDSDLHTQLKYLESLFDYEGAINSLRIEKGDIKHLPDDHVEVYNLLKKHMSFAVENNAYNWIRPSLWSTLFGRSDNITTDQLKHRKIASPS